MASFLVLPWPLPSPSLPACCPPSATLDLEGWWSEGREAWAWSGGISHWAAEAPAETGTTPGGPQLVVTRPPFLLRSTLPRVCPVLL